jgi:hypothetical protein
MEHRYARSRGCLRALSGSPWPGDRYMVSVVEAMGEGAPTVRPSIRLDPCWEAYRLIRVCRHSLVYAGRNGPEHLLSAVCKATPKAASRLLGLFQKRFSTKFAPLARIYYHFVLASPAKG